MIELRTGKPGSGKTCTLIEDLMRLQEKEQRPVYFSNVDECVVPGWQEFPDPTRWQELPAGAILVVDEAQKYFPMRKSDKPPEFVSKLSEHRHLGIDLYLITQDGGLVDVWVRKLAARHVHVVATGTGLLSVTTWNNYVSDPTDPQIVARHGDKVVRRLPKKVFGMYKSADLHTVQVRPNYKKLAFRGAGIVAIVVAFFYAKNALDMGEDGQSESTSAPNYEQVNTGASIPAPALAIALADQFTPEVNGLPWSAPFYRPKVSPENMPIVMGCMSFETARKTTCRCEDQQGTKIPMPFRQCMEFMTELPYDWSGERERVREQMIADLWASDGGGTSGLMGAGGGERGSAAPAPAAPDIF